MIRHRSMLACVAIVATIGVGLPGLVAATAGASTEPPPPSAPIDDADGARLPDGTDPGAGGPTTTTSPVTTDVSADPPTTTQAPTTAGPTTTTTTVAAAPPSTTQARRPPPPVAAPRRRDSDDNDGRAASELDGLVEHRRHDRRSSRQAVGAAHRGRNGDRLVRPDPPRLVRPVDQRRFGDHRLRHPTLRQRGLDLDHHRRRGQHLDHVHRERLDEPHPLPLPGLRPQRHRVEPGRQRRHGDPGQCAHCAALVGGGADQRVASAPPHVDGAAVQRRAGDHRLHHPTITQRLDRVDDDRRRRPRHHGVHRDRTERRHPLLLPHLRQDVDGDGSIEHHRQRHSAHQALGPPFHHRRAEQPLRPGAPDVGGAVVERRRGDHRLPHPTVVERHDVDEHR